MKTGRKTLLSRVLVLALVMALALGTALAPVSAMAEAALADRCTATNPRSCTAEEIEQIFRKAYSGKLP